MKRETFKAKVIANAYLLKNKFGENCKGHNRQLIATVLLLFFAIKTVLPKSQNTKTFGNEETFGNKINEERNIQSQSNCKCLFVKK